MKATKGSKKQPASSEGGVPGVDLDQLEQLLAFMSEHGLEEFEYTKGDLRIRLKKASKNQNVAPVLAAPVAPAAPAAATPVPVAPSAPVAASHGAAEGAGPVPAAAANEHIIKSPIVGT